MSVGASSSVASDLEMSVSSTRKRAYFGDSLDGGEKKFGHGDHMD